MRAAPRLLFYRPLASPLHAARAGVAACWALALTAVALIVDHPLALLALLLGVLLTGALSGVGRELPRALALAAMIGVPIVVINVLVSRQGLTVFARLGSLGPFGQGNLTTEALAYGAVVALKLAVVIVVTTLASLAIDPDELLRIVRRLSFRSALTASLALRMIPLLAADAQRVAEAQRTRPGGPPRGARARLAVVAAIVSGSLDRAMDVAATLEVRGFAVARRARASRRPWSRHDAAYALSAAGALGLALVGARSAVSFGAYPLLQLELGVNTALVCLALCAVVAAPSLDRRGIKR
jgi:energy-coupling factor transport system permease protein